MSCRKKIDSKLWNEWSDYSQAMESEVRAMKQDLVRTQEALKAATKRCRDLVRELDNRTAQHESERVLRNQQLSRILRALLVLESRLKQEQKSIRQLLCEKDNVIRNQQLEIAKLRRYTKNYIKGKRDQSLSDRSNVSVQPTTDQQHYESSNFKEHDSGLSKDIQNLKCEIITKLNEEHDSRGIKKTHSFAGSDISKASLTSSENTDASIITTTTEGSPSLVSTEGFCEGESTDVSPGSTLNKSSRCTPTIVMTDSDNETITMIEDGTERFVKSRRIIQTNIARTESKDDGMDCNFISDEEEKHEPIYANTCTKNNAKNLQERSISDDCSNNNVKVIDRIVSDDHNQEEISGNWYSDPDESIHEEVFRHSIYQSNSNHNSVLECVNQILLRDMEDDENVLSIPRSFKHRGKIVRFQPARLSDIESVGSEMERRNSEEQSFDKESPEDISGFEATGSEDEFGMKIIPPSEPSLDEDSEESKAKPIIILEPEINIENLNNHSISFSDPSNTTLRIEDQTCLPMPSKGLTIAKNLDYEDIESLSEIIPPSPKTPPALPPKPQFRHTMILKKIPSPSFLIDETRRKLSDPETSRHCRKVFSLGSSILKSSNTPPSSVRSLKFDQTVKKKTAEGANETGFWKNRFNNVRSSFHMRQNGNDVPIESKKIPKVTNIVKHFEEFKIEDEERVKPRERHIVEFVDEFNIQQNFEEFNLDECDLTDDPSRLEADGSETIGNVVVGSSQKETSAQPNADNNNATMPTNNSNSGYDHFLEATGLSQKSILTPSRLFSNHKSMLKPKDIKYKNKIKATAVMDKHVVTASGTTHTRHWTGPFV